MATTVKPMTQPDLRGFIEEYLRAWNEHDVEGILAHLTDDVVWAGPALPEPVHGLAAARKDLEETFEAFPDLHFPAEDNEFFVGDDPVRAVGTWTFVGTMTGRMRPGYEPTGKPVRVSGACSYRFRDGRISEHTIIFDALDFLTQLGLMPEAEGLGSRVMREAQNLLTRTRRAVRR